MKSILLRLPLVKFSRQDRPSACPQCQSPLLIRWGSVSRQVLDPQIKQVLVHRWHCRDCGHTFRRHPDGISRQEQSKRLVALAAALWALGLSVRSVSSLFAVFGLSLGRMSVWRDVCGQAKAAQAKRQPVRVLGLDGFVLKINGKAEGLLVAVDMGNGQPVALGIVDERDPKAVLNFVLPLVKERGVEVFVTDDLASYQTVSQGLNRLHQICRFHVRRWVGRALSRYEASLPDPQKALVCRVDQIVEELAPSGGKQLWEMAKAMRVSKDENDPRWLFKQMLIRLSNEWANYRVSQKHVIVPATNNRSEQAIGNTKIRSRSVRGWQTFAGVEAAMYLCNS